MSNICRLITSNCVFFFLVLQISSFQVTVNTVQSYFISVIRSRLPRGLLKVYIWDYDYVVNLFVSKTFLKTKLERQKYIFGRLHFPPEHVRAHVCGKNKDPYHFTRCRLKDVYLIKITDPHMSTNPPVVWSQHKLNPFIHSVLILQLKYALYK